jgi:hypothetical protein
MRRSNEGNCSRGHAEAPRSGKGFPHFRVRERILAPATADPNRDRQPFTSRGDVKGQGAALI